MPLRLSLSAARALMLAAQGLHERPAAPATKANVVEAIRRIGALQIDTINVVARSPYLVLWSRLGAYETRWLDELLAEGALFEYWSHAACFLPVEDYPLYRHRMRGDGLADWWESLPYLAAHREEAERMLALIRERGPVRSADFARQGGRATGWWDWKPEKRLLEALFDAGLLMVARRERFQRVYDLRERVLPSWDDPPPPPRGEAQCALLARAVRALGVATPRWAGEYFHVRRKDVAALLADMAGRGVLVDAAVEGVDAPAYVHPDNLPLADAAARGDLRPRLTTLLSPFDPLVCDRGRVRTLFGFDFALECYTPAARRRYGYYALPVLRRGELIGRLDAKVHRREGRFQVKALYLEPGVAPSEQLVADLGQAVGECAAWHGASEVIIDRAEPPEVTDGLRQAVRQSDPGAPG